MGLNLAALAKIKADTAAVVSAPAIVPAPAQQTTTSVSSAGKTDVLAALSTLTVTPAKPTEKVESAGTINFSQVSEKIRSLDAAVKSAHPTMRGLLQEVWNTLNKYPECVTLLQEDEMEVIISGLEKIVDTDLAAITIKSATSGKKSKTPVSAASLGF